ncbi:hypothetical protein CBR_g40377 [Chara braunii]|uniref:Myb-like domain-containing protein n=1 Tax=Chara braunii TaxID=69332 RepID=A0A388LTI6_CHABU|nr:hypothetical protein CBR_g40377 [Chara braunii]|eukprot:GBG85648.1 hypothetical protein CBR_g40377 [Chara braunii]
MNHRQPEHEPLEHFQTPLADRLLRHRFNEERQLRYDIKQVNVPAPGVADLAAYSLLCDRLTYAGVYVDVTQLPGRETTRVFIEFLALQVAPNFVHSVATFIGDLTILPQPNREPGPYPMREFSEYLVELTDVEPLPFADEDAWELHRALYKSVALGMFRFFVDHEDHCIGEHFVVYYVITRPKPAEKEGTVALYPFAQLQTIDPGLLELIHLELLSIAQVIVREEEEIQPRVRTATAPRRTYNAVVISDYIAQRAERLEDFPEERPLRPPSSYSRPAPPKAPKKTPKRKRRHPSPGAQGSRIGGGEEVIQPARAATLVKEIVVPSPPFLRVPISILMESGHHHQQQPEEEAEWDFRIPYPDPTSSRDLSVPASHPGVPRSLTLVVPPSRTVHRTEVDFMVEPATIRLEAIAGAPHPDPAWEPYLTPLFKGVLRRDWLGRSSTRPGSAWTSRQCQQREAGTTRESFTTLLEEGVDNAATELVDLDFGLCSGSGVSGPIHGGGLVGAPTFGGGSSRVGGPTNGCRPLVSSSMGAGPLGESSRAMTPTRPSVSSPAMRQRATASAAINDGTPPEDIGRQVWENCRQQMWRAAAENITTGVSRLRVGSNVDADDSRRASGDESPDSRYEDDAEDGEGLEIRPVAARGGPRGGRGRQQRGESRGGRGSKAPLGDKGGKHPAWSVEEMLKLAQAKRDQQAHFEGMPHNYDRMRNREWKLLDLQKRLAEVGVNRATDHIGKKWDNVFQQYKKVQRYQNMFGGKNFFTLTPCNESGRGLQLLNG